MTVYCTYCSAGKDISPNLLAAIERYKSNRIISVYQDAKSKDLEFYILSGKYGILNCNEKIEYYDHLLVNSEIEKHSKIVADQLVKHQITNLVFYSNLISIDKNIKPYLDCISLASKIAGIALDIVFEKFED